MGYCYTSNGALVCDNCGNSGHVRKRTCPAKVRCSSHKSASGTRPVLPYCHPPALCPECWKKLGGNAGVHAKCYEGAAKSQLEYDREQARLDAGDSRVSARWGSWHETVPQGSVGVCFASAAGLETWILCGPDDEKKDWLSEVSNPVQWEPHA